jgi:hypothetical protein
MSGYIYDSQGLRYDGFESQAETRGFHATSRLRLEPL